MKQARAGTAKSRYACPLAVSQTGLRKETRNASTEKTRNDSSDDSGGGDDGSAGASTGAEFGREPHRAECCSSGLDHAHAFWQCGELRTSRWQCQQSGKHEYHGDHHVAPQAECEQPESL